MRLFISSMQVSFSAKERALKLLVLVPPRPFLGGEAPIAIVLRIVANPIISPAPAQLTAIIIDIVISTIIHAGAADVDSLNAGRSSHAHAGAAATAASIVVSLRHAWNN